MSEIILRDICKSYENGFQAVKNFNLEIEKGELVVFRWSVRMRKVNHTSNDRRTGRYQRR